MLCEKLFFSSASRWLSYWVGRGEYSRWAWIHILSLFVRFIQSHCFVVSHTPVHCIVDSWVFPIQKSTHSHSEWMHYPVLKINCNGRTRTAYNATYTYWSMNNSTSWYLKITVLIISQSFRTIDRLMSHELLQLIVHGNCFFFLLSFSIDHYR